MLVFGMKDVSYVVIDDQIAVRVKWEGNDVKLCIEAPKDISIERDQVYEKRCRLEGKEPKWQFDKLVRGRERNLCRKNYGRDSLTVSSCNL